MAPSKFMPIAPGTDSQSLRSVENKRPENKIGKVIPTVVKILPPAETSNTDCETNQSPSSSERIRPMIGRSGECSLILLTIKLAKYAINKMAEITIAITYQVLPQVKLNSVIAFVSISMKPAPRKKKGRY